ncbi:hypothetical protein J4H92_12735 [Leucobacter weissii]|uniref:Uncharacterized protein n=1 Tax=Leucobacter weissii TaxID=1983706 RepID=A0A939MQF7_9MICO|nr:hypothetical protein [Leucobacter weissii]MBO1902812.1 hypothetical protein [Leucobacter weissii]
MCATVLWAVNAAAFTPGLRRFTLERIGREPEIAGHRIASEMLRPTSVVFTLTLNMCDCGHAIGSGRSRPAPREATAESWLAWMRGLPQAAPHLTRIAALRAWNPDDHRAVTPIGEQRASIDRLQEATLRALPEGALLAVDYPRPG